MKKIILPIRRTSKAREELMTLLQKTPHPLSHQEIMSSLKKLKYNRVTVYRNLEKLLIDKLIHKALGPDGVLRFSGKNQLSKSKCTGNHSHFFCVKCKKMDCLSEMALPWIPTPKGSIIVSKQLIISGVCAKCNKGDKNENLHN